MPPALREESHFSEEDVFMNDAEDQKFVRKPIKEDILSLRGSVKTKQKPIDFRNLRDATRKKVAREIVEEGSSKGTRRRAQGTGND
ncbi:MAG: hypothetical protein JRJ60_20125 [Deltaproteobacteria bacterium]|nr:hypothetical protein [Deltaproteobacteria bacterium]